MIKIIKSDEEKEKAKIEHENRKQISKLVYTWKQIMAESGIKNNSYDTLTLSHIKIENYGFSARIYTPYGLNFDILENLKPSIEHGIGCTFTYKYKRMSQFVTCQIITKPIEETDFKVIKTKPWELYLGTGIDSKPIIVNMLKFPHLIDTGATGMGKTKLIDCITTNSIYNCTPEELGLFLIQVDKCDQAVYRRCKHTRAYADTIEKALAVTNYLLKLVEHRNKQLESYIDNGTANNIFDYNKHNPKCKWVYYYLIIDEYSSLMPDDCSDSKETKDMKKNIQGNMERIAQLSRSTGLYIILGLQRSTINKLPSYIKAMMNVNVAFRANNSRSSQVAIDCDDAVFLDAREAIVKINEMQYMKTVTLTNKMIVDWIDKFRVSKALYKDNFRYNDYLDKKDSKTSKKSQKNEKIKQNSIVQRIDNIDFSKVDPICITTKEKEKEANIKKIPHFVPYNPNTNLKIIDETKIPANLPLTKSILNPFNKTKGDE